MFRSIASKLIVYSNLWIIICLIGFGYVQYRSEYKSLHEHLDRTLNQIESRLASNLPMAIWKFDQVSLIENIQSEARSDDVRAIQVVDVSGEELAVVGDIPLEDIQKINIELKQESNGVMYPLGEARVYVNTSIIEMALQKHQIDTLTQILLLSLSLSLVIYWISRVQVTHPMAVLEHAMDDIAKNEQSLYQRIVVNNVDNEIARVSNSFNSIILNIKKLNESVENKNAELQKSIDDLQNTQKQLIESEKLASLGSLVAGVAHEINTPVGVGITAATTLSESAKELEALAASGKMTREHFDSTVSMIKDASKLIYSNLDRVGNLVNSFKQVAVDRALDESREVNLHEFMGQILDSIRPTYKHCAFKFTNNIDKDVTLMTHPGLLAQVCTNLFVNSAFHGFEPAETGEISISVEENHPGYTLIFKDTGRGMEQSVVDKVFEPFFTTKRNKGGTGLGLHIVHNIVSQKLCGEIKCESTLGSGTVFRVVLPETI